MGLFGMKKKPLEQQPIAYSPVEQGVEKPVEPQSLEDWIDERLGKVLANQAVIVQNQQVILDGIVATQQLMVKLAGEPVQEEQPPEPVQAKPPERAERPKRLEYRRGKK